MKRKMYPHIEYRELPNGENYEGDFNEHYCPGQSCALSVTVLSEAEIEEYCWEEWRLQMNNDLIALGFKPNETVYIEVDY